MPDCDSSGFLDDLPELDLPDPPPRRVRKPDVDPVQRLLARVPLRSRAQWEDIVERFRVAREQVCTYFRNPAIKKYWVALTEAVAASEGRTLVFEKDLEWPADKAKFYAVMAVCAQRCGDISLLPDRVRQTQWYQAHERWLPEYVNGMDTAPQLMAHIEQDLRAQGLLDDGQPGESNATQRSAKVKRGQRPKTPGRSPKYTPKQKALAKKRFEDLMASGHQVSEAWAIVAEEHGFPSGDAARKRCT